MTLKCSRRRATDSFATQTLVLLLALFPGLLKQELFSLLLKHISHISQRIGDKATAAAAAAAFAELFVHQ